MKIKTVYEAIYFSDHEGNIAASGGFFWTHAEAAKVAKAKNGGYRDFTVREREVLEVGENLYRFLSEAVVIQKGT